jgi:DNA-binding LytR/AlgR family response regulator
MNCLIVEDEPLAASILEDYCQQIPFLKLVGKCPDTILALEAMRQQPVDALFLDIHLPGQKGLDFLRSLPHPPQTILTTAYHEYALDSYEYGVVDYLLKPIDFERFVKAVHKLKHRDSSTSAQSGRPFHFFNCNKKMVRIWLDEIAVVESLKEYVRLHLINGNTLITKSQLGMMERILDARQFIRVHRSYLVSIAHIAAYSANSLDVGGQQIPIGRQFKNDLIAILGGPT